MWRSKNGEVLVGTCRIFKRSKGDYKKRSIGICDDIIDFITSENPDHIISEYPHKGGIGAATKTIGALYHFCGMLHGYVHNLGRSIDFYEPMKWKGTLPKHVTQKRVREQFGLDEAEDIMDAIGLGNWYLSNNLDELRD